ncbi:LytTR family DNA-binding domain-containing protein [Ruminococcus sp. Marseille-P6503]|uniref:LytTR family DNA-binding domain-containing protein n=1 Tax=Ruminococcus sp. Marseille-P6503 TaxID=2364796 RepID=UPI000F542C87|nr:LytTR family DNA-binding domain-containing protein [Ruminococcus sp. Marseille-P6503]
MKIRIVIDSSFEEDEVVIRCRELNENIRELQKAVSGVSDGLKMVFYKRQTEYFMPLDSILFFETSPGRIDAHTTSDVFQIKHKLYELEEILPIQFIRASKSAILNINHIYSIEKNLTSSSLVKFRNTHKQVYVSRNYYKALRIRISERRNYEE